MSYIVNIDTQKPQIRPVPNPIPIISVIFNQRPGAMNTGIKGLPSGQ